MTVLFAPPASTESRLPMKFAHPPPQSSLATQQWGCPIQIPVVHDADGSMCARLLGVDNPEGSTGILTIEPNGNVGKLRRVVKNYDFKNGLVSDLLEFLFQQRYQAEGLACRALRWMASEQCKDIVGTHEHRREVSHSIDAVDSGALPTDVLHHIMLCLDDAGRGKAASVCTTWRKLHNDLRRVDKEWHVRQVIESLPKVRATGAWTAARLVGTANCPLTYSEDIVELDFPASLSATDIHSRSTRLINFLYNTGGAEQILAHASSVVLGLDIDEDMPPQTPSDRRSEDRVAKRIQSALNVLSSNSLFRDHLEGGSEVASEAMAKMAKLELRLWLTLAQVQLQLDRFDDCIVSCGRALQLQPSNVGAMVMRGQAYGGGGDNVRMERCLRSAENELKELHLLARRPRASSVDHPEEEFKEVELEGEETPRATHEKVFGFASRLSFGRGPGSLASLNRSESFDSNSDLDRGRMALALPLSLNDIAGPSRSVAALSHPTLRPLEFWDRQLTEARAALGARRAVHAERVQRLTLGLSRLAVARPGQLPRVAPRAPRPVDGAVV